MTKEKITYQEKYKPHKVKLKKECLPTLKHIEQNWEVFDAYMLSTGACALDNEEVEFHDIRVFVREKK